MSTRPTRTRIAGLLATTAIVFAACSSSGASTAPSAAESAAASSEASAAPSAAESAAAGGMDALIAAAKAEGELTTIALPHNWCNYGEMLTNFKAKYGIPINELNPDGGSADEDRRDHGQQGQHRARRRRTSSTSACPSARRPRPTA